MIRISVITPTLNRGSYIESAVDSVATQSIAAFEHIVIDGGSSDDTLTRLARYPHLDLVSEPDRGLYDAINKGIRRARGDVICLLNSDDHLWPGALAAIDAAFRRDPATMSVCGRVRMGNVVGVGQDIELGTTAMQLLRDTDVISGLPLTNARVFRREVFERIGEFDQAFPILADRDFLGRYWLAGLETLAIDQVLYRYGIHDQSLSFGSGTGQLKYNEEAVRLASLRLSQSGSARARHFYCRWLGWGIGYMLLRAAAAGEFSKAYAMSADARAKLQQWPLEFLIQMSRHVATRQQRRGRTV
jgi:glycosyltransferase involved in cell wall biosynthesis